MKRARRDIVLTSQLGKLLKKQKLASPFKGDGDFVFPAPDRTPGALEKGDSHLLDGNTMSTSGRNRPKAEVLEFAQQSRLGS
jgi:hypothetical protein